ncbi:MAG: Franean1_4349 family RiPP [Caldilineae bacterium]|nr:Franean1_4349 family RiPP [Caldilineae bacterium]
MSKQSLEAIIGRAMLDEDFRTALFADPDQALAGYRLTRKERMAIANVDAETLDVFAERLQKLLSGPDYNAGTR